MSGDEQSRIALQAIAAAWNAASQRWDAQALAAIYTEDALFFGGRPAHSVGRAEIHAYFASYQGIIESARLALMDQHLVALAPGVHLAQGIGDFSFVLSGGRATQSRVRTTLVIVQQHQDQDPQRAWQIRQHHFSPEPAVPPLGD